MTMGKKSRLPPSPASSILKSTTTNVPSPLKVNSKKNEEIFATTSPTLSTSCSTAAPAIWGSRTLAKDTSSNERTVLRSQREKEVEIPPTFRNDERLRIRQESKNGRKIWIRSPRTYSPQSPALTVLHQWAIWIEEGRLVYASPVQLMEKTITVPNDGKREMKNGEFDYEHPVYLEASGPVRRILLHFTRDTVSEQSAGEATVLGLSPTPGWQPKP
ncbi:hypothetical protein M407DRAFT_7051 [Tulasnella calospora MUT 4182]|uniref:Uncharacterized protein n=1 Tax=Tulasnella calospora MUT 4182 TaxID=1051891 RepID=A0A0C3QKM7_9AGAM|nr:hypothetical protein M407DRAFT_7051 [Tulasnella calospora MUT 4182]